MTLLKEHLLRNKSAEEGLQAFANDVGQRHPQLAPDMWGLKKQVICHWLIEYESRADTTATLLMMPLWLFGQFHFRRSRFRFTTFHYLTQSEARRLRWGQLLKQILLPAIVLGLLTAGIALFIALCILVAVAALPAVHGGTKHPIPAIVCAVLAGLVLWAMLKAQRLLWKIGQPPHTDDFRDQKILLRSVTIA